MLVHVSIILASTSWPDSAKVSDCYVYASVAYVSHMNIAIVLALVLNLY